MRTLKVAVSQFTCDESFESNIAKAENQVRAAAKANADIILLQELFERPYFCKEQHTEFLDWATPVEENPAVQKMQELAKSLGIVIPVSFFERDGNQHFNSMAMIDANGALLGVYRKSHIPDGPGYQEKFYFTPGNTGFKVWETQVGVIGVGICWDQWFPEVARSMALMGAELLLYPTAIGSEPKNPGFDSSDHWQTAMRGHAASNIMPLAAANRVGIERAPDGTEVSFYGRSFISDHYGQVVEEADRTSNELLMASFELDTIGKERRSWGVFRDRRPELYGAITSRA